MKILLKRWLEKQRMSQSELARLTGLNQTTISNIVKQSEDGEFVNENQKKLICKATGLPMENIIWPTIKVERTYLDR